MSKRPAKKRTQPDAAPAAVSQRELARALGINHSAVKRGIERGRLPTTVEFVGGEPVIKDLATAVAEWKATRRPRADDVENDERAVDDAPAALDRNAGIPDYAVSRAKREYHLAEIAEAEARSVTGGEWLPVSKFEELNERYLNFFSQCVRHLRERMPLAVNRRINLHELARLCAALGARTKHVCGQPLPPLSDEQTVFRVAMSEIQIAVDEVCTELSQMAERLDDESADVEEPAS